MFQCSLTKVENVWRDGAAHSRDHAADPHCSVSHSGGVQLSCVSIHQANATGHEKFPYHFQ